MQACNPAVRVSVYCREAGKGLSVIATETRPYLQGTRLTAWELARAKVTVAVIPDGAVAQVLGRGEADAVVVGADRCAQNGDVINKVGTYPLALMAHTHQVPFYALVQDPGTLARGADVVIEDRPAEELLTFQGESIVGNGKSRVAGCYPAFDVTPARLISGLVGFDGVFTPESFREKYLGESAAAAPTGNQPPHRYLLVYGTPGKTGAAFLRQAIGDERADGLLVPEMRPELWGARQVVPQLLQSHVTPTLISDNMMGSLFARGEIHKLYLFYDERGEQGVRGGCGSLVAVNLAGHHGVPIELQPAGPRAETPLDRDVATFLGHRVLPAGVSVYPIEEELIPWSLLRNDKATNR